jgi:hypothetical protein
MPYYMRGLGERHVDLAEPSDQPAGEVALVRRMQRRGAGLQGRKHVTYAIHWFDIDADRGGGICREVRVDGDYQRHGLAHVAHPALRQHRTSNQVRVGKHRIHHHTVNLGEVISSEDRHDPWHRSCSLELDIGQQSVR